MRTNDEKVRLKIRLDDTEKAKLEHEAALCGLTRSESVSYTHLTLPTNREV